MPDPQEILDFARTLSHPGIEDLLLQLLSRQSNKRKQLIEVLDELLESYANSQVVSLLLQSRTIEAKPGLMGATQPAKRSRAG